MNDNLADDDLGTITVCQGPPSCDLRGDEAEAAQRAGCVWCQRITIHADHSETIVEPSRA
jgi:hypothetical protein